MRWNRRLRLLCLHTLCWISRKFHLHFTLMFLLKYYKMVESLCKSLFKNHMTNLINFRQAVESPKSWNLMGFCPKKYIPSAKVDLSNIAFNYLCVDSPNYLCHIWNHKAFFATQLLCIFSDQTLHTFNKSSP